MLDDLQHAAANALPPRREDEPPTLRQEILDELTDHFACAYRRELLRTRGDAELSKRNVRGRFGNPAHIARKLWFDAMKGKLMAQKFMVFTTCLSVVLMAFIAFMGWRLVEASQQATSALIARSQETSAALLAQSEKTHAAILARLEAQGEDGGAEWGDSLEWSEFELKFVEEGTREPATGVTVSVYGPISGQEQSVYTQQLNNMHPNAEGKIQIAPLHIGQYSITVQTPWDASSGEAVHIRPGHDFQKTYIVPKKPETGTVDLDIEWPKRLQGQDFWAIVGVSQDSSRVLDGMKWQAQFPRFFAMHTDGRIIDLGEFYKGQRLPVSSMGGLGGGMGGFTLDIDDRIEHAAVLAVQNHFEPGLRQVPEGTWSPWLLGIYPHAALPEELVSISKNPLWVGIGQEGEIYGSLNGPLPIVSGLSGYASVNKMGEITHNDIVYRYPEQGVVAIEADSSNQLTITIPEQVANAIPENMLLPRTPVEAPKISRSIRPRLTQRGSAHHIRQE